MMVVMMMVVMRMMMMVVMEDDDDGEEDETFASQASVFSQSREEVTDLKNCNIYQKKSRCDAAQGRFHSALRSRLAREGTTRCALAERCTNPAHRH